MRVYTFHMIAGVFLSMLISMITAKEHDNLVICPIGKLTELSCMCYSTVPNHFSIVCEKSDLAEVFGALRDYNQTLDTLSIKNCNQHLETLSSLPKLKIQSLEISRCTFGGMDDQTFAPLADSLEHLSLVNNSLTTFPLITSLRNLKTLNLNRNDIKDVPDRAFSGLKKLMQVRLKFNHICHLQPNSLNDLKDSLELFDLSDNCLTLIPAQAIRNSPVLKYLSFSGNFIEQLLSMQFMNLPNLIELRLNNNQIRRMQTSSFMNIPKLRHLFLHSNNLSYFDPGTLQIFNELELIDLNSNQFTKVPSFKDMSKLVEIRIGNNRIKSIDTLDFTSNPNLRKLAIQGNSISSIARNSFDSLDSLDTLILSNNSLTYIERTMFDGIKNLRALSLRNNSISRLGNYSFASIPDLAILDMSRNMLTNIPSTSLVKLHKLSLLDISNNSIETLEDGAFQNPISTIMLDGNQLNCDERLDWFIVYLIRYKIRVFLPGQPDILCTAPESMNGKRLKDHMMKKNNGTLIQPLFGQRSTLSQNPAAANLLSQFLPGLMKNSHAGRDVAAGSQLLGSLAQNFPAIRDIPGLSGLTKGGSFGGPFNNMRSSGSESPIDQFAEPLIKFASGATPQFSDVNRLLTSLPNLVVRVPNFGDVDVSKLSPGVIEHVLRGGQIPGIPRETLDFIVKQYMDRMYSAAAAAQGLQTTTEYPLPANFNQTTYLRPLTELPPSMIKNVLQGRTLPYLSEDKTRVIKDYYTQQLPIPKGDERSFNLTELIPPKLITMMSLLPPNYPIGKIPPQVIKAAMANELPDFSLLPDDLQLYIRNNIDKFARQQTNIPDLSLDEVLKHLPYFPKPQMTTFSPYDINRVDSELVIRDPEKDSAARLYTAIALGLIAAATLSVLTGFCMYLRSNRNASAALASDTMPDLGYNV